MKNIVLVALMLLGLSLPTNARAETTSDSLSVLLWLEFKVNNRGGDVDKNEDAFVTYSLNGDVVDGKLYVDGKVELEFDVCETVTVSIKLDNVEVNCTEFVPTVDDKNLTFDLDDFGNGIYEINVTMPDGSVQTATFEY